MFSIRLIASKHVCQLEDYIDDTTSSSHNWYVKQTISETL